MTVCPIAIAVGCRKCPVFGVCPLKGVIGDYRKEDDKPAKAAPDTTKRSDARPEIGAARAPRSNHNATVLGSSLCPVLPALRNLGIHR